MNSYELSRLWFDFAFDNPSKITPAHGILYFFCIENCNRLGWKKEFGLPTTMAKEAIGIRSYNTYINTLNDLVDWGFIILIEKSKNQYSSNIIALSNFNKAHGKALDKAMSKHMTKQCESTIQSISSIDKHINNITINQEQDIEERQNDFPEPKIINTSPQIEIGQEKKVAPKKESENEVVIYPIEQIQQRLSEWEYELIENSCKVLKITVDEYKAGVAIFIFEQGDGLKKDYSEVKKHFRSWLKINVTNIRKSLNNKNLPNGKPQKIGGIDIETLERNHATIENFKRKEQDSGDNDW